MSTGTVEGGLEETPETACQSLGLQISLCNAIIRLCESPCCNIIDSHPPLAF